MSALLYDVLFTVNARGHHNDTNTGANHGDGFVGKQSYFITPKSWYAPNDI